MKLTLAGLSKFDFFGVLLLRIGIGALLIFHGWPALVGGNDAWKEIGSGAAIAKLPESLFWMAGLASSLVQLFGGLLLLIGLFTRASALCATLALGFALANLVHELSFGLEFFAYLQLTLTCFSLAFIGPGRLSLDRKGI